MIDEALFPVKDELLKKHSFVAVVGANRSMVVLSLTGDNLSLIDAQEGCGRELTDYSRAVARVEAELADAYASISFHDHMPLRPGDGHHRSKIEAGSSLSDPEASSARCDQIEALRREYDRIAALPAAEAASFLSRRQDNSATALQARWRSVTARRAFRAAVQRAALARRVAAVVRIQRIQRVRRCISREAGPPISSAAVAKLSETIGRKTVGMAAELQEAGRHAAAGKMDAWPSWHVSPSWLAEAEAAGGSSLVQSLRTSSVVAQHSGKAPAAVLALLSGWGEQRAALQARTLRRQVDRTTAAALHAQLLDPPALPTAAVLGGGTACWLPSDAAAAALDELVIRSSSSAAAIEAHRSALRAMQVQVDAEDAAAEAVGAVSERGQLGGNAPTANAYAKSLRRLEREAPGVSASELLWLASLEAHHDAVLDPYPA